MPVLQSESQLVNTDEDVVHVRSKVKSLCKSAGLGIVDQTKMVTAASELARNIYKYGGGGIVHVELLVDGNRKGIHATFIDQGPGIANVEEAITDGYTTGNSLGLGLGGAKRLVDEFEVDSQVGKGTTISITKWKQN